MLAICFRALFYIKLRVVARICFSITCYIDGMLANFFPGIFLYKIKSGRAHLFFYNMLHRWNAREFFSELILI